MDVSLGVGDLLTVAGAGAFAAALAQFVKVLLNASTTVVRTTAMLSGVAVVVGTTITSGGMPNFAAAVLAVYVGMQAGMSASAMVDTIRDGLDYNVMSRSETMELKAAAADSQ